MTLNVWSSTFSNWRGSPPWIVHAGLLGVRSSLFQMLSTQNMTSSVVKSSPSDHFNPLRNVKVNSVESSLTVQDSAMLGCGSVMPVLKNNRWSFIGRSMFCPSAGPVNARYQVPPYLPMPPAGWITNGFSGSLSSTGGRSPAATMAASIGASLNDDGLGNRFPLPSKIVGQLSLAGSAVMNGERIGSGVGVTSTTTVCSATTVCSTTTV